MEINQVIMEKIQQNNNMITTSQVVALGFSRALLSKYVKEGLLERSRQGVYILPNSVHDDMYTLMLRSEKIIFSHDTALFLNGLSERTPFTHSVTIPSNAVLSDMLKEECNCYYIKPELFQLGMVWRKTTFGNEVRCYNLERTICDLLRSRSRMDEETVISAIKNYAVFKDKDLNCLAAYAEKFKVSKILKKYGGDLMAGKAGFRRDSKHRVLRRGESIRADGKYQFKYHVGGMKMKKAFKKYL